MTPKQKAAIERARREPARFIAIDPREGRVYRETAYERQFGKLFPRDKAAACLEAEQRRLIETWEKD